MGEYQPTVGDVIRYSPDDRWCREGIAIVSQPSRGRLVVADTYWSGSGSGETHILTASELSTAELMFRLDEYDELKNEPRGAAENQWKKYLPAAPNYPQGRKPNEHSDFQSLGRGGARGVGLRQQCSDCVCGWQFGIARPRRAAESDNSRTGYGAPVSELVERSHRSAGGGCAATQVRNLSRPSGRRLPQSPNGWTVTEQDRPPLSNRTMRIRNGFQSSY